MYSQKSVCAGKACGHNRWNQEVVFDIIYRRRDRSDNENGYVVALIASRDCNFLSSMLILANSPLVSGVLAITVSQAVDSSSNSILDAFEVYAVDKPEIDSWLPKKLQDTTKSAPSGRDETLVDSAGPHSIILTSRSLESLCDILGTAKSLPKTESDLLKRMVQHTAVNRNVVVRDCVDKLLCRLYPSPQARNSIRDEGALQGCSLLLSKCQVLLETTRATEEAMPDSSSFENGWFTVRALLRSCLRAAAHIARRRPINYLRASDVIAENKISSGSIAVDSR